MDLLLSAGERVTSALLAIALNELGYPAVAFSDWDCHGLPIEQQVEVKLDGKKSTHQHH